MQILTKKPFFVLRGETRTPPMGREARQKVGFHLREVQQGVNLTMPLSHPMPQIQKSCEPETAKGVWIGA